jgi:hypothetical protein
MIIEAFGHVRAGAYKIKEKSRMLGMLFREGAM